MTRAIADSRATAVDLRRAPLADLRAVDYRGRRRATSRPTRRPSTIG